MKNISKYNFGNELVDYDENTIIIKEVIGEAIIETICHNEQGLAFAQQLIDAKQQGFEEGQASAIRLQQTSSQYHLSSGIEKLHIAIDQINKTMIDDSHYIKNTAIQIGLAVGRSLAKSLLALYPIAEIENILAALLKELHGEKKINIYVTPSLFNKVKSISEDIAKETDFSGKIVFFADNNIGDGNVLVEWTHGEALWSAAKLEQLITDSVNSYLAANNGK